MKELDKEKIEKILLGQGLSTRRSKNLAEILSKSDILKEEKTTEIFNISEVVKED